MWLYHLQLDSKSIFFELLIFLLFFFLGQVSASPKFVPGVWGPYYSAMVPHFWSNEGGQSAAGQLVC